MRRRIAVFAALALVIIAVAPTARAVPMLVDLKWENATGTMPDALEPGSKSNGMSAAAHEKQVLRQLSIWISKDGKEWHLANAHFSRLLDEGATVRAGSGGKKHPFDLTDEYAFKLGADGTVLEDVFVGVSSSSTKYDGKFSARLVSIRSSADRSLVSIPEPSVLALFAAGLLGLGLAVRARRRI